jgi:hypothetical protein
MTEPEIKPKCIVCHQPLRQMEIDLNMQHHATHACNSWVIREAIKQLGWSKDYE